LPPDPDPSPVFVDPVLLDPIFVDSRLNDTSIHLAELGLCQARLQADARWPWIVLIPRRPGLREIEDLEISDRVRLTAEIILAGQAVRAIAQTLGRPVEKLNVGQLGNVVPQLHVHVLGRRADDPAWPGPVWGFGTPIAYAPQAQSLAEETARRLLMTSS
jgi:diadenosine tetraphosphate (Ap4A) HIT family hydrolase